MKVKLPWAWSGLVCFSTMIVPRLVFVKVQVTVSPADSSISSGSLWSEQVAEVRSQPSGVSSETE